MTTERKEMESITHSLFKCQQSSKMYREAFAVKGSLGFTQFPHPMPPPFLLHLHWK